MQLKLTLIPATNFIAATRGAGMQAKIDQATRKAADSIKTDLESSTATFDHEVAFAIDRVSDSQTDIATTDKTYGFLNDGTSVRYATMIPGYARKTLPGRLAASSGDGSRGVLIIDRTRPRPGIEARHFTKLVAEKNKVLITALYMRYVKLS
jgi:hypothetical protein